MESAALQQIARSLKTIESHLSKQNHILQEIVKRLPSPTDTSQPAPTKDEPVVVPPLNDTPPPKIYGWSMAASVQREGGLNVGDIKIEEDESRWFWTGEIWERVEAPSGN